MQERRKMVGHASPDSGLCDRSLLRARRREKGKLRYIFYVVRRLSLGVTSMVGVRSTNSAAYIHWSFMYEIGRMEKNAGVDAFALSLPRHTKVTTMDVYV